jgi:hypothetical protein
VDLALPAVLSGLRARDDVRLIGIHREPALGYTAGSAIPPGGEG